MTDATPQQGFTEASYRELVRLARERYPFLSFREATTATAGILWRHDIDVSVHRALALARIEHDEGVRASYFVHLHSRFYNAFEDAIVDRLRAIAELGHELGVHFDPHFHRLAGESSVALSGAVAAEAAAIESLIGSKAVAVSFHDPDVDGWTVPDEHAIAGLVSTSGRAIRERFGYCSDSNGSWRFAPLSEELTSGRHERLHVLTHPEWWVPEPMSPRARIARAIDGRAAYMAARYDAALAALSRENLR